MQVSVGVSVGVSVRSRCCLRSLLRTMSNNAEDTVVDSVAVNDCLAAGHDFGTRSNSAGKSLNDDGDERDRREYLREYYDRNKDKMKDSHRDYRVMNGDRKRQYLRQYYDRNRDNLRDLHRDYNLENNTQIREYFNEYYNRNKDTLKAAHLDYRMRNKAHKREYDRLYRKRNKDNVKVWKQRHYIRNMENPDSFSPRDLDPKSWRTPDTVREYFDSIAEALNVASSEDWYRVSRRQIGELGGSALYLRFRSLGRALQFAYPEVEWDLSKFSFRGKKSEQRFLKAKIEEILPGVEIIEEYQHPDLIWDHTNRYMEMDLWIPQHRIGLEYQGEHHYYNMDGAFGPSGTASLYCERDLQKVSLCQQHGITMILIPYWWDGELGSLSATLYQARPDVFPVSECRAIPTEMPTTIGTSNSQRVLRSEEGNVAFLKRNASGKTFSCQQENGAICNVRASESEYENAPREGSVLRVRYSGMWKKTGKYKSAVLVGAQIERE